MDKQLIYQMHQAHAVMIDGQTFMPTNYFVDYINILDLLERRVKENKNDPFITYYAQGGVAVSYTYDEFRRKVFQTANYLRAQGLIEESRVATVSYNHIDTVVQYFAAWCAGMTVVPINIGEGAERIKYILEHSETKLAFVRDEFMETISNLGLDITLLPSSEFDSTISAYSDEFGQAQITDTRVAQKNTNAERATYADLETEALIVYTSGTTGLPKGVVLTQYNLLVDADAISRWHGLSNCDAMMCVLPIHHVNGIVVTLITPMVCGGRVVLNQKFQTDVFFERLAAETVKIVSVVPTLLQFLLHADIDISRYNLANFKHFICGAGPLTVELAMNFEKRYGLKIVHGYGLSETTCYSCFLPTDLADDEHQKWMSEFGFPSIGTPIPPNEMAIVNTRGEKVREGWRGEIVIRGHNVMKGYYQNHDANMKAFEHGWFHSGDEGFFKTDAQGRKYFFITGRLKELIIRGGVNLSPLEIDEVLNSIAGVKCAIAVGFENDWYGEEVGALVQLKDGVRLSEADVLKHCAEKLPFPKQPKAVVFSDDIPVTSTGKYQRNKAKDLFKQWKTVQFKEQK